MAEAAKSPSVRRRLTALVLACLLPFGALAIGWIAQDYRSSRQQLSLDLIARARAAASAVDRDIIGIQRAMAALATSPHLAARDWAAFHRQAAPLAQVLGVSNVVVVDARFQQVVNTVRPVGAALPYDDTALVRAIFRTAQPLTSDAFVGPATGRLLVAVGSPVLEHGKVAFVLGVGVLPERLSRVLGRQELDPEWIGVILDRAGSVVARTHQMEKFAGTKASPELLAAMRLGREGFFEGRTLEGIRVASAFSRSTASDWTVAIGIPARELEAHLWRSLGWLVAGAGIAVAIAIALARRIAATIARPLHELAAMAETLGNGELPAGAARLGLREADEVGDALRNAVEKLARAEHRALHDPLTGLANRALFAELVERQIAFCRRQKGSLAVLFADLDGFKEVNDRQGHATGDEVLRTVAGRLAASIRESDVAARLGGDEFAVLLAGADWEAAANIAAKLAEALQRPYAVRAGYAKLSASIGVAVFPDLGGSGEELLKLADQAMYQAKQSGGRGYALARASRLRL